MARHSRLQVVQDKDRKPQRQSPAQSVSPRSIADPVDFDSMLDDKPEPGLELETGLAIPQCLDTD